MKKIFSIIILTINLFSFQYFTNYKNAIQYAKYYNKPIFLMIVSSGCPHCINFAKSLSHRKDIMDFMSNNYVVLIIDTVNNNFIPPNIDYNGYVPYFDLLLPNGYPYAPSIKGEINLNALYEYLYNGLVLFNKLKQNIN